MSDSIEKSSFPFDPIVHLRYEYENIDDAERLKIKEVLDIINAKYDELYSEHIEWLTDEQIIRFLVARNFVVKNAVEMIVEALRWRSWRKPSEIMNAANWNERMSKESETGKIYCSGNDRWGRSVLVLDNTVQNTNSVDDQMTFLAWNMEFAIMNLPPNVDKYLVFVNLSNWSFFNQPPFSAARETMQMLATCYPERLGHCIAYCPPSIFKTCWNMFKGFLDPKTVQKIVFITGDVSDGSENDVKLREIIGDNWKALTGGEQPVLKKGCSPGYDHAVFWPTVQQRLNRIKQQSDATAPVIAPVDAAATAATAEAAYDEAEDMPAAADEQLEGIESSAIRVEV